MCGWDEHEAPVVRILWNKTPRARRSHQCGRCNEEIVPGTVYESVGLVEEGSFLHEKRHLYAYRYPSGCPSFAAIDRAEMEAS